jgi:transposase
VAGFTGLFREMAPDLPALFTRRRAGLVVENPDEPTAAEETSNERGLDGLDDDESPPPRRGTKRGIQTKGVNRAGITTKIHLVISAQGHVIEGFLTPGNTSDITVAKELTAEIVGCYVAADAGYDSDPYREILRGNNNIPVIPGRKNRTEPVVYDKKIYRLRGRIEKTFGAIKEHRRLTVRYEKSDILFLAFIAMALIKPYL